MFEDQDIILPDDFEAAPEAAETQEETEATEPMEDSFEPSEDAPEAAEDTTPAEEEADPAETSQTIRIKYNHEEQEIPLDEAVPLVQKGMNYDKLQERVQSLESDPRLSFVEELAREEGLEVDEFINRVRDLREQQRVNELVQQNIPEQYAKEMLETRKFREQIEQEKKQQKEKEKADADFQEFFEYFKQANDREYSPQQDKIPDAVWNQVANGVPLKFAYMAHHANELQAQIKVLKNNKQNEVKAPVQGVSTHGSQEVAAEDDFLRGFDSI